MSLDQCDAIASSSEVLRAQWSITPTKRHLQQLIGNKNETTLWHSWIEDTAIKPSRSAYDPDLMPSVRLKLFKYVGSDNAQWISTIRLACASAATLVQWKLAVSNAMASSQGSQRVCYQSNRRCKLITKFHLHIIRIIYRYHLKEKS